MTGGGTAREVALVGVAKSFGPVRALHPTDLQVRAGELLVLLGPSGCGKSTLLRIIAGLEEPTAGQVWIGGERVDDRSPGDRDVAMVFQSYALYPHMSVRENLGFGLRVRKVPRDRAHARVREVADVLGLAELLDRRPGQLSGGQRQRVALGRAMVREPGVFLFDEPLSNLDARLRLQTRNEIAALHRRLGTTMIFVTHDQVEAMSLGDRVAVLEGGRLQQIGTPDEVYRVPANLFVAGFVGTPPINRVSLDVEGGDTPRLRGGHLSLPARGDDLPRRLVLAVRPEDLEIHRGGGASPPPDLHVTVERVESLGSEQLVHVSGPEEEPWVLRAPPTEPVARGDGLALRVRRDRAHLFEVGGMRWGSLASGMAEGA